MKYTTLIAFICLASCGGRSEPVTDCPTVIADPNPDPCIATLRLCDVFRRPIGVCEQDICAATTYPNCVPTAMNYELPSDRTCGCDLIDVGSDEQNVCGWTPDTNDVPPASKWECTHETADQCGQQLACAGVCMETQIDYRWRCIAGRCTLTYSYPDEHDYACDAR